MLAAGGLTAIALLISPVAFESIYGRASVEVALHTTTVRRGTVEAIVTATGKLAPVASLGVNFTAGGVLSEVDVKIGDQVKAGQTLARIDDTGAKAAVASAQGALTSAQQNLVNAQRQAALIVTWPYAVAAAQQQVAAAESTLNATMQGAAGKAARYQGSVNQIRAQLARDLDQLRTNQAICPAATNLQPDAGGATSCAAAVAPDQDAIAADNDALVNAILQQSAGQLRDEQSIHEARGGWLVAQDILESTLAAGRAAASSRVAPAQSQVTQAQGDLATAQKNEADTTLIAPRDGTVAVVNGVVGQTVSGSATAAMSGGTADSADSSSSSAPGASAAFLTLVNDSALQVVVGFTSANAYPIEVGAPATISPNALPDQPVLGQVSEIGPNSALVGGVIMRNVVVTLTDRPATLKAGMTANVKVVAAVRDDVLEVPTADITRTGGTYSVVLVHHGTQIPVEVTTGLVGDQFTEITSGLYEGEIIVDVIAGAGRGGA